MQLNIFPPKLEGLDMYYLPVDYYDFPCVIPWGVDVVDWLTLYKWGNKYEANFWDCSKMTTFTEWALENCGYSTKIQTAPGHAWVEVKIDNHWYIYETTSRHFVMRQPAEYEQETETYDSIHELVLRQQRLYFENPLEFLIWLKSEWAWWLTDENN